MARTFGDGTGNRLSKATAVVTGTPFSMACWIYVDSFASLPIVLALQTATDTDHFLIYSNATGTFFMETRAASNNVSVSTASSYGTAAWIHVAASYTSSTSRALYTNNTLLSDSQTKAPATMTQTDVGWFFNGSSNLPNVAGTYKIAFLAWWNVALSATDVNSLFVGGSPKRVRPAGLVSYGRLDGNASPEFDVCSSTAFTITGTCAQSVNPRIYAP